MRAPSPHRSAARLPPVWGRSPATPARHLQGHCSTWSLPGKPAPPRMISAADGRGACTVRRPHGASPAQSRACALHGVPHAQGHSGKGCSTLSQRVPASAATPKRASSAPIHRQQTSRWHASTRQAGVKAVGGTFHVSLKVSGPDRTRRRRWRCCAAAAPPRRRPAPRHFLGKFLVKSSGTVSAVKNSARTSSAQVWSGACSACCDVFAVQWGNARGVPEERSNKICKSKSCRKPRT